MIIKKDRVCRIILNPFNSIYSLYFEDDFLYHLTNTVLSSLSVILAECLELTSLKKDHFQLLERSQLSLYVDFDHVGDIIVDLVATKNNKEPKI